MRGTLDPCRLKKYFLRILVVLLVCLDGINASACKRGCPLSERGVFHFRPGSVYNYNFESVITISLATPTSEETSIKVQGRANVYPETNCGYTLKLERVQVIQSKDGTSKGVTRKFTEGVDKPVQFTLNNGALDTEICTDPSDTDYSVNLKRAIISMFQRSNKPHETDIFGVCPTTTTSTVNGKVEIVTKVRNLNSCMYREVLSNGFVSGLVNERAGIKTTPLLTGYYSQEQEVSDGIIERAELHEDYKFVPLANSQTGAGVRAKVRTTLKRTKTAQGNPPPLNGGVPQSIIFRNPRPVPVENMDVLRATLAGTVNDIQENVKSKSAQQLAEIIRLMRNAGQQQLTTLYRDVRAGSVHPSKDLARKIFLDALFRAGTDNSIATIIKLLETELKDKEERLAYMSFNLVENVDEKSLESINALLDKNPPKEAYLSIGHLVNKYCNVHNCEQSNPVNAIANKFAAKLANCQAQTKKQEDNIVNILKGIGNAAVLAGTTVNRLVQCTSAEIPARVRVAALQALQSASCSQQAQSIALNLLKNRNEDSEIRIEAYLTLVACPSAQLASQIAEIVNSEPVYQVGGFISSHLKSIRDSSDPYRESARHHFSNIRITKQFPVDPRKYSFNSELSYALESLGLGASTEYSLIYSQRGFLPRSARLNLTAELFGHDFNLLEVSLRQENLEQLMEHYFGPKGFFTERSHEAAGKQKRSLSRENLNSMAQKFKQFGKSDDANLILDYSVKMFGSEMVFLSLGEHIPDDSDALAKKIAGAYNDLTDQAKNFRHDCGSHSLFLDSELVYPTGMGFPLQMIAQGTGVGRFKLATNLNLKDMSNWKNEQYRVKFVPSVNVDLNAQMKIDAQVLSTGLKVRGSFHTSTGSDVTVKITDGRDYNIDIDLPFKKQEVFNFNHEIEFIVEDPTKETVHIPIGGRRVEAPKERCFDQLALFGLTVCGMISGPVTDPGAPGFPLNGPTRVSLSVETEKKIHLNLFNRLEEGKQVWAILYDTPGSQKPHSTELKFELGTAPKWYGRLSFKHPEQFLAVEAGLKNDDTELALYGQYEHNHDESKAKIGFKKIGSNEYEPMILIAGKDKMLDNIAGYRAAGKIVAQDSQDGGKRYVFQNIQILDPTNHATVLNGWIQYGSAKGAGGAGFGIDMNVRTPENKEYVLKSQLLIQAGHYVASATVLNRANPPASGSFKWELLHPDGLVKNNLEIGYGPDLKYGYSLYNEVAYESDKSKPRFVKFQNNLESKKPEAKIKLNGQYSQNILDYDFAANFGKGKVGSTLVLRRNQKLIGDYDADLKIELNNNRISVKAKRAIEDGNSVIEHWLKTTWGTSASLKGKYSNRWTPTDAHVDLVGSLQLTDKEEPLGLVITLNATPKNTQGSTKVTRSGADILAFNANYVRGENANGKFDITVKDMLAGHGEAKWKNGVGDVTVLFNLKKLARKIKLESKYQIARPTYNIDATIYYNFEKDNAKKLTFNTQNQIQQTSIDSNSALDLNGQKCTFAIKGQYKGDLLDGTIDGNFNLGLPNGRQISGDINRKSSKRDSTAEGYANAKLTDRLPDGKQRSLAMDVKFSGFNPKARLVDLYHKFTYINTDGKDGVVEVLIKHLPNNNNKMVETSFSGSGALLEHPVEFNLKIDEYSKDHAVYRMSGKYGNLLSGNVNGNYKIGGKGKPTTYQIQMTVDAPKTQFQSYKMESSGHLLQPEAEDGIYDAKIDLQEQLGDRKIKFEGSAKGNAQHGSWSANYDMPKVGPGKFEGNFVRDEKNDQGKYQLNMVYDYGQSRVIRLNSDASYTSGKTVNFHYILQTPNEKARKTEVVFKGEKSDAHTYNGHLQMTHNDKSYGLNTVTVLSDMVTSVDVNLEHDGKTSKFYGSVEQLGDRKGRAKLKIDKLGEFGFDGSAEISAQSFENFYLKVNLDSKKLNLDQVHIEANSKPKSGGKGVEFKATAAGKNILSGSAEYNMKHDKNKVIVEGKGNMQLYEKPRQVSFKLIHQTYDLGRDSELGYSIVFNGLFGARNIESEFKVTSKNFIMKIVSCEDKKQCANIEVRSITLAEKDDSVQHKLMVLVDLQELGWPHEFELQSKVSSVGYRVEQELRVVVKAPKGVQYQLQTYIRQKESAIILITPHRKIALENVYQIPSDVFGKYETSSTLYLNKDRSPDEKSKLSFTGELSHVAKTAINLNGKLCFEHPRVKPMTVAGYIDLNSEQKLAQGSLEFDIFKKPSQKIIASVKYSNIEFSARGVNVKVEANVKSADSKILYSFQSEAAASFEQYKLTSSASVTTHFSSTKTSGLFSVSPKSFEITIIVLNEPLFTAHGTLSTKQSELKAQYNTFGGKPVVLIVKSQGLSSVNLQVDWRELFKAESKLALGKEAVVVVQCAGQDLFNGRTALDPSHFLSTQYKVNEEGIKDLVKRMEEQAKTDGQQVRAAIEQNFNKIREQYKKQAEDAKDSLPDFSALQETYERNIKEIIDEISSDTSLRNIVDFYKRIFEAVSSSLATIVKSLTEFYRKFAETAKEFSDSISKLFTERILPIIQNLIENISTILHKWYSEVMKAVLGFLETLGKVLKSFEPDFNRLGKIFADFSKQVATAYNKLYDVIQKEVEDLVQLVKQFIESLPKLEEIQSAIKKYIGNLDGLKQSAHMVNDVLLHAGDFVLTQEFKDFTQMLHTYLAKKISQEEVNDFESLKTLYVSLVKAIRSLLTQFKTKEVPTAGSIPIPFSLDFFRQVPMWSTLKFSPFNYLRNEQWSSLRGMLTTPHSTSTKIPAELQAHIADGEHIFTFDGRHMTFPGSCSYVLVQDLDNKFSVVANLQGGKMKSITLTDKSNMLELLPDAQVKLNNKPAELPIHNKDTHAWRRYYSVFALSEYGVEVKCSLDLRVCHVHVSGYYTGKTRGLLGNGNNEPYDDFTLPNGKITDNPSDCGNNYALSPNCPPVNVHQQHGKGADGLCKELFDEDSSLMLAYLFLNPSNYLEACNHAVEKAQDKQDAACNIALTYASAARDSHIPVDVPDKCLKCSARKLGDSFETKTPQKKADVIFVVDTAIGGLMNDLVQNVITDLRTTLKQRDMADAHISLIAYNENMRYPQIYTTNGKLDFTGKCERVDLSGAPRYDDRVKTGIRRLTNTYLDQWEKLVSQTVAPSDAMAFNLAMEYPFRPDANRAVIAVRNDQLQYSNMLKLAGAAFSNEVAKSRGIGLHLIGPVKDFEVTGRSQQQGNIVGFDKRTAVVLGDAKKRVNFGSPELRNQIRYSSDMGTDFVQDNGGFVFVMQNYEAIKDRPKERKQYTMAVAVALSDQLARTELTNECECRLRNGLVAEERCKAKEHNMLPPQAKRAGARG